ncbi:MAG: S-layer homology domain-containing protein [Clostridiales bacterium]|nr:S-layer homology domain-containing protein [Clostridiales bacterium]
MDGKDLVSKKIISERYLIMKRIISIILLICIIFTILPADAMAAVYDLNTSTIHSEISPTPEQINPFADISKSDWFYDDVLYVLENGIFNGSGEDTFSPYGTMTRAMYVTVIGRIAGINPDDYLGNGSFADVEEKAMAHSLLKPQRAL